MRAALRHPLGLLLFAISLVVAATMGLVPALGAWSSRAPWIVLWGFIAYVAVVILVHRPPRPEVSAPELREMRAIRRAMEARLAERRSAERGARPSELTRVLSEAIVQLEEQFEPALCQLLERQRALSDYLSRIENGSLPQPDRDVLERLRAMRARQEVATEECVQQAANAAGTLVALLQEGDDANVAAQARTWAKDLLTLYEALANVLRGEREEQALSELIDQLGTEKA